MARRPVSWMLVGLALSGIVIALAPTSAAETCKIGHEDGDFCYDNSGRNVIDGQHCDVYLRVGSEDPICRELPR